MTKLSVNINKVATIRNARGNNMPNVQQVAIDCEKFGAQGITVHPRPDERHIRYTDVYALKPIVTTEFNIEGYPDSRFIDLVLNVKPHQVTLVPDKPDAITSNAGWDTAANLEMLKDIIETFQKAGIRTSLFVDTNLKNIEYAAKTGTNRIEFYTEPYANQFSENRHAAVKPFIEAAEYAQKLGLGINAGHDLNLDNLQFLHQHIPYINEVSIGHALISDALYYGLYTTIQMYLKQLQ